ncbi:hypothetical protein AB8Q18_13730 [Neisseriaceae bacterium CLB008]
MTTHPHAAAFEAAFLANLRQLAPYLHEDLTEQNEWYEVALAAWQAEDLVTELSTVGQPSDDLMAALLYLTHEAGAGLGSLWHHIDWKDTETLVAFAEACAASVLPQGLQWSVADPAASLNAEDVLREANQQLIDSGHQLYNMDGQGDAYFPVWVKDQAGFLALAERLNLTVETFLAPPSVLEAPVSTGGSRAGRILAWLLLPPVLLGFALYRLVCGVVYWLRRG